MRTAFKILACSLLFTATAAAQEELRPQPAPVTYAQVEQNSREAKEHRLKAEAERKAQAEEYRKTLEAEALKKEKDTIAIKKASTKPGKQ